MGKTAASCLFFVEVSFASLLGTISVEGDYRHIYPLVMLAIRFDDDSHIMPYFFGLIENLDYPKDRMSIDIYIGQHNDATTTKVKW
ncbi:unnamed protein product [Dracunculus medinensis]|uniref:MULE domain-containing protein n=1 Tax=Dracunculus medinensis TaxID=318479 RepID=A0A0N4UEF1_DRAME|nr:unnamed protein product [Dracunculus medinensis]